MTENFNALVNEIKELKSEDAAKQEKLNKILIDGINNLSADEKEQTKHIQFLWDLRVMWDDWWGSRIIFAFSRPITAWVFARGKLDYPAILRSKLLGPVLKCDPENFSKLIIARTIGCGLEEEIADNLEETIKKILEQGDHPLIRTIQKVALKLYQENSDSGEEDFSFGKILESSIEVLQEDTNKDLRADLAKNTDWLDLIPFKRTKNLIPLIKYWLESNQFKEQVPGDFKKTLAAIIDINQLRGALAQDFEAIKKFPKKHCLDNHGKALKKLCNSTSNSEKQEWLKVRERKEHSKSLQDLKERTLKRSTTEEQIPLLKTKLDEDYEKEFPQLIQGILRVLHKQTIFKLDTKDECKKLAAYASKLIAEEVLINFYQDNDAHSEARATDDTIKKVLEDNGVEIDEGKLHSCIENCGNWTIDYTKLEPVCKILLEHALPKIHNLSFYHSTNDFITRLIKEEYYTMVSPLISLIQQNKSLRDAMASDVDPILDLILPLIVPKNPTYQKDLQILLKPLLTEMIRGCDEKSYAQSLQSVFQETEILDPTNIANLVKHIRKFHPDESKASDSDHIALVHYTISFLHKNKKWRDHFFKKEATDNLVEFLCKYCVKEEPSEDKIKQYKCVATLVVPLFLNQIAQDNADIPEYTTSALIERLLKFGHQITWPISKDLDTLIEEHLGIDKKIGITQYLHNKQYGECLNILSGAKNITNFLPPKINAVFSTEDIQEIIKALSKNYTDGTPYNTLRDLLAGNSAKQIKKLQPKHLTLLKELIPPKTALDMLHQHLSWSQYFISQADIEFVYTRLPTHSETNTLHAIYWSILLRKMLPIITGLLLAVGITSSLYFFTGLSALALSGCGIVSAFSCVPLCVIGEPIYQSGIQSLPYTMMMVFTVIVIISITLAKFSFALGIPAFPFTATCFLSCYGLMNLRAQQQFSRAIEPTGSPANSRQLTKPSNDMINNPSTQEPTPPTSKPIQKYV